MPALFGRENQLALLDSDLEPILLLPPLLYWQQRQVACPVGYCSLTDLPVLEILGMVWEEGILARFRRYRYMCELKRALDAKGNSVLEMPTGTG